MVRARRRGHLAVPDRPHLFTACTAVALLAATPWGCGDPCGEGTLDEDGTCVAAYPRLECGQGTEPSNGSCVPSYPKRTCGTHTVEVNGACVVDSTMGSCSSGTIKRGESCVPVDLQYVGLPFAKGTKVTIAQGYQGYFSHNGNMRYAVDFPAAVGTRVMAARGGIVVQVKQDSDKGCSTQDCAVYGNMVRIDHGDATFASYWHLKYQGALVKAGDIVCKGQAIGLSGNTGWSTGAHLHFEVASPLQETLPLVFDEMSGSDGMPIAGPTYTSQNAEPTSCSLKVTHSTCPKEQFKHLGILLDSGFPCSVAKLDTSYPVSGKSLVPGSKVMVSLYLPSTASWYEVCLSTAADGSFSDKVSWASSSFSTWSYVAFQAASSGCERYQGFDTSVLLSLH